MGLQHPLNRAMIAFLHALPRRAVRPLAMNYIAGEKMEDAVRVLRELNAEKMMGTVDILGEDVSTRAGALQAVQAGEEVLRAIARNHLNSTLSIKLTQFGIRIDKAFCYENLKRILETARAEKNFVRIDMEDSSLTGATLNFYERLRAEGFENVGVVVQAYLRRSAADVRRLIRMRANIRVVKGIYVEPETIAFQDPEEIRRSYLAILKMLLEAHGYTAIATHDDVLIEGAYRLIRDLKLKPVDYEFQMLYGVRPKLRGRILSAGHRMRIYVPFGEQWHAYSLRRFKENPRVARYVLQALLARG